MKLSFAFEELECWRTLCVPKNYSFYDLHFVIQTLFNWLDYHLYDFRLTLDGEKLLLGESSPSEEGFWDEAFKSQQCRAVDVESLKLEDVFPQTTTALYSYDYGDGWEINVEFLSVEPDYPYDYPACIDGKGDCPPDDAGGEGGFKAFLAAIADKGNPEHDFMVAWGKSQGFEHFDLKSISSKLPGWRDSQEKHNRNKRAAKSTSGNA